MGKTRKEQTLADFVWDTDIPMPLENTVDSNAQKEFMSFTASEDYEADSKRLQNQRYDDDTKMRKNLASVFTVIIAFWLIFVVVTVWRNSEIFKLSDNVLITLLTTTTVNVIGMMLIILRNLFPGSEPKQTKPAKRKPKSKNNG